MERRVMVKGINGEKSSEHRPAMREENSDDLDFSIRSSLLLIAVLYPSPNANESVH